MICNDGALAPANLYRFVSGRRGWTLESADRQFVAMQELPDNDGVLLIEDYVGADWLNTIIYRAGIESSIVADGAYFEAAGQSDPSGRFMALFGSDPSSPVPRTFVLDLQACLPGACTPIPVEGVPHWSPDSTLAILSMDRPGQHLTLADGAGRPLERLGQGTSPIWLDNRHYAYRSGRNESELRVFAVGESEPVRILRPADLATEPADMEVTGAVPDPGRSGRIYLTTRSQTTASGYLFAYDLQPGTARLLHEVEHTALGLAPMGFSPDKKWLALVASTVQPDGGGRWRRQIVLVNNETGDPRTIPVDESSLLPIEDWTSDGRWLLQLGNGFILLTDPERLERYLIRHDFRDCTAATWVLPDAS
jgi:hypothetical protein